MNRLGWEEERTAIGFRVFTLPGPASLLATDSERASNVMNIPRGPIRISLAVVSSRRLCHHLSVGEEKGDDDVE